MTTAWQRASRSAAYNGSVYLSDFATGEAAAKAPRRR
jgi:hypothetical protein